MRFIVAQGQPPTTHGQTTLTVWLKNVPVEGEFLEDGVTPDPAFAPTDQVVETAAQAACDVVAEQIGFEDGGLFGARWEKSVAVGYQTERIRHSQIIDLPDPDGDGVPN